MDLATIRMETDGKITAQILDSNNGNQFTGQSSSSLQINEWTLLSVTFQTDTDTIMSYLTIYFGNVPQYGGITSTDPVSYEAIDYVVIGGYLTLDNPLKITKISYFSPGSNYVADQSIFEYFSF